VYPAVLLMYFISAAVILLASLAVFHFFYSYNYSSTPTDCLLHDCHNYLGNISAIYLHTADQEMLH